MGARDDERRDLVYRLDGGAWKLVADLPRDFEATRFTAAGGDVWAFGGQGLLHRRGDP